MSLAQKPEPTSSWFALRYPHFRSLFLAEFMVNIGASMQLAAVNWQVWQASKDELALGLVGLARVIPIVILALIGGVIADALDRRRLLMTAHALACLLVVSMAIMTLSNQIGLPLVYLITSLLAGITAFESPARVALLPALLPKAHLAHGARINTLMFPITAVVGPVIAGLVIEGAGPEAAYTLNAACILPAVFVLMRLKVPAQTGAGRRDIHFAALKEGLHFVWSTPALRGSMLLDFFATFFSSAMALLPVYADQILQVGPTGYGILYAAPAAGSIIGAMAMAQIGSRLRNQGQIMLRAVGIYGLATIIFGFSDVFAISFAALAVTGLADAVSMMIRSTMRQLLTPDRLRGRMISVNMIFFMGGPQLGEFEAGLLARLTSTPISVISGGVATVLVVALMATSIPALRGYQEAAAVGAAD
jgi:MFS family permease